MKILTRRAAPFTAAFIASALVARAHPVHDGHDFSWDFRHLVDHPDATILCLAVLGAVAWFVFRVISVKAEAPKTAPVRIDESRREG